MSDVVYTFESMQAAFKRASSSIKAENKGSMYPVHIEKNWEIRYNSNNNQLIMTVHYFDGNAERQVSQIIVE